MTYAFDEFEKRKDCYTDQISDETSASPDVSSPPAKRQKMDAEIDDTDPLAELRSGGGVDNSTRSNARRPTLSTYDAYESAVSAEMIAYDSLVVVTHGRQSGTIFGPLAWWGQNTGQFPLISKLAEQILVIHASSAESERNFSTAGKITRKDRANLSSSTVVASVVVVQALKKDIISSEI